MVPIFVFGLILQCVTLVLSGALPPSNCSDVDQNKITYPEFPCLEQVKDAADAMFHEYWEIYLRTNPESATVLGDNRYDDQLSSYSIKCYEKWKVVLSEFLERANQLLSQALEGSETEINLQLFTSILGFKLHNLMAGSYVFPVSKLYTPQMALMFLTKYTKLNTTEQYMNLISRYRKTPQQIDEIIELFREGIRTNYTLHEVSMIHNHDQWNQTAEESPFYNPFRNISDSILPDERDAIQENATDAIENYLIPSFMKFADFMDNEYSQHTRAEVGVGSMPNGREYYQAQLSSYLTDAHVTPEEIHQLGISEVARITEEMEEVIRLLGSNLTRKEFTEQLKSNKSQYWDTEEEAIGAYRHVLYEVIPPKLTQIFKYIPKKRLRVEKVPAELATGPQAFYQVPSGDGSIPGTFFLDTTHLGNVPKYDLISLSLHEGVPGHHFQHSYGMEQTDVPEFRKHDMSSSAYMEGWALYSEFLGYELGLYEDLFMRYGHLSQEIFRACRLVVDTGLHVMGWSRQKAIDYMLEYSASSLGNIENEVDRYITWPGQACSYKFGELKFKEFRKRAVDALGENFDIKKFHDVSLRMSGPLEQVSKQVDRYIRSMEMN